MWDIVVTFILVASTSNSFPLLDFKVKYDNYKVYRFVPQTKNQVRFLSSLEDKYPGKLSFWQSAGKEGHPVDIMISPNFQSSIYSVLQSNGISLENVMINDVQKLIDKEKRTSSAVIAKFPSLTWNGYYGYEAIMEFLDEQVKLHPKIASLKTYGQSFEGRPLKVIKISKGGNRTRPIIFMDANIHAREWITNAVATYVINELLNGEEGTDISKLLNTFDFQIAPVLNPDGYEYSRNFNRMWRLTRSNFGGPFCRGVDPNRNFGFKWNTGGTSDSCFADNYRGPHPFSESETKSLAAYYTSIHQRVAAYLSLHCYSQLILIPYATKVKGKSRLPDHKNHMRVAKLVKSAIARRYGTEFKPGSIVDILYIASGSSSDWVKGTHNTTLAYTFELRDTGQYGFLLPAEQIVPSSLEFIDGLVVLAEDLKVQLAAKQKSTV